MADPSVEPKSLRGNALNNALFCPPALSDLLLESAVPAFALRPGRGLAFDGRFGVDSA
jgi:hypothetical protein